MADVMRYPIGEFVAPQEIGREKRMRFIDEIAELPALLRRAVTGLSDAQLDTPYRPGGWTVRQVVHHLPDSHLNGYARMKLALTEHLPAIKTYNQEAWVAVTDLSVPVEASLRLLEGLHQLWAGMLRSLSEEQWQRGFIHPELVGLAASGGEQVDAPWRRAFVADERGVITVAGILPTYAWHGRHHTAQITSLRERMGWN
jgi:DinB superfamily